MATKVSKKTALNSCGRLKKGYMFLKGGDVVKVPAKKKTTKSKRTKSSSAKSKTTRSKAKPVTKRKTTAKRKRR